VRPSKLQFLFLTTWGWYKLHILILVQITNSFFIKWCKLHMLYIYWVNFCANWNWLQPVYRTYWLLCSVYIILHTVIYVYPENCSVEYDIILVYIICIMISVMVFVKYLKFMFYNYCWFCFSFNFSFQYHIVGNSTNPTTTNEISLQTRVLTHTHKYFNNCYHFTFLITRQKTHN